MSIKLSANFSFPNLDLFVRSAVLLTVIVLHIFGSGCGRKRGDNASDLNWGHLDGVDLGNLIAATPSDRIEICGINPEATMWAVLSWAKAIGRAEVMSKNMVPCQSGGGKFTVNVSVENGGSAPAWTSGTDVTINSASMDTTPTEYYRAILLHEIGHAWGMCDQYADMNCDSNNSTSLDNSSVMGSTSADKQQLTAGDIEGLRALANRPDIGSAATWQGVNSTGMGGTIPNQPGYQPVNNFQNPNGTIPNQTGYPIGNYPPQLNQLGQTLNFQQLIATIMQLFSKI